MDDRPTQGKGKREKGKVRTLPPIPYSLLPTPYSLSFWLVFRWRMRGRSAWRDLIWAGVLLVALLVSSAVLQTYWAQMSVYSGEPPEFLLRWLTMGAVGAMLLFL